MRSTFIVLGKLMGLLIFYVVIAQVGYFLATIGSWLPRGAFKESGFWMTLGWVVYMALLTVFAFVMIFRTEKVADWVGLREEEEVAKSPSVEATLLAGIALIGIYILVRTLPEFAAYLLQMPAYSDLWDISPFTQDFVDYVLRMALALLLIFKPRPVARFIAKRTRVGEEPAVPDETRPPVPRDNQLPG
jgi:hypothetical protein